MSQSAPDESDGKDAGTPRSTLETASYLLSLPERALRTGTGVVGGVVRESATLLVPQAFQNSRTYTVMVRQMLDFLVHDVGGVAQGDQPSATAEIDNYVARKSLGNFLDMASLATLHLSPALLLAAVSDIAYGSQAYLKELAGELKAQGIIDEQSSIHHVNDLLNAIASASATTGDALNTPPLSVDALRQAIEETRAALAQVNPAQVLPQAEVRRMWEQMREIAEREHVGLLAVSGTATLHAVQRLTSLGRGTLSSLRVAGTLLDRHVFDHYENALAEIRQRGLYRTVAETSEPYIAAVWDNFQPRKRTLTERLLSGQWVGPTWRAVRQRFRPDKQPHSPDSTTGRSP